MPDLSSEHQLLIAAVRMSPEPSAAIDALVLKLTRLEKLEAALRTLDEERDELLAWDDGSHALVIESLHEAIDRAFLAAREEEAT